MLRAAQAATGKAERRKQVLQAPILCPCAVRSLRLTTSSYLLPGSSDHEHPSLNPFREKPRRSACNSFVQWLVCKTGKRGRTKFNEACGFSLELNQMCILCLPCSPEQRRVTYERRRRSGSSVAWIKAQRKDGFAPRCIRQWCS